MTAVWIAAGLAAWVGLGAVVAVVLGRAAAIADAAQADAWAEAEQS